MVLSVVNGCHTPSSSRNDPAVGVARNTFEHGLYGDNPIVGAVAVVAGVVDAKKTREKQKQKEEQESVNAYLEQKSK